MKHSQETEDVALYVEQRQPTEEEERLFRAFMQNRTSSRSPKMPLQHVQTKTTSAQQRSHSKLSA
ncbi:MAG: hypothetical protein MUF71_14865 [Candidatus Kapabacteria bacterium]|jgi:hypothetical protein|nr:hypothetical protein [Candidatus Kapabacteria bacterium]